MRFRYTYKTGDTQHVSETFTLDNLSNAGDARAEILAAFPDAHSFLMQKFVEGVPSRWEQA